MSAEVQASAYEAFCDQCFEFGPQHVAEDVAVEWAANHNAERHETDNSDDEAYEKFKESRGK